MPRPSARPAASQSAPSAPSGGGRPGPPARPVIEHPPALWDHVVAPLGFAAALDAEMRRHGDSAWSLHKALVAKGSTIDRTTLRTWRRNAKAPVTVQSLAAVDLIEHRYRLPAGYLRSRLSPARGVSGHALPGIPVSERRRLAWHLPDDFSARSLEEQAEIVAWVRETILTGGTDYHRYHAAVSNHRFAFRFDHLLEAGRGPAASARAKGRIVPPARLEREMADLLRFKTRTLTEAGFQRSGVWGPETASQKLEHLGLMFGALAAAPDGVSAGLGLRREQLTLALLVSPAVWDWYVQWRERRRGFYTGGRQKCSSWPRR